MNISAPTSFGGAVQFQVPRGIVLIKPYGTMAFGMFSFRAHARTLKVKLSSRIAQLLGPMFQPFWPQLVWTGRRPLCPLVLGGRPEI